MVLGLDIKFIELKKRDTLQLKNKSNTTLQCSKKAPLVAPLIATSTYIIQEDCLSLYAHRTSEC